MGVRPSGGRFVRLTRSGWWQDPDSVNGSAASVHHFGHVIDKLVELGAIKPHMIGPKLKVRLHAEDDMPVATFDFPFVPASHDTVIFDHWVARRAAAIASAMFV